MPIEVRGPIGVNAGATHEQAVNANRNALSRDPLSVVDHQLEIPTPAV
jgi:hypothetical protein